MARLTADFSTAFKRDLKKKASKRHWDLEKLQELIALVLENTPEALETLKRRHNMHELSGKWKGRSECHVANAGDWLVESESGPVLLTLLFPDMMSGGWKRWSAWRSAGVSWK